MSNFACPHCGSDQIQRYSVAFSNGISDVNTNTVGIGVTGKGLGIGGAKTTGVSQTALSQSVAPPQEKSILKGILKSIIVAPIACMIFFGIIETILGIRFGSFFVKLLPFLAVVASLYYLPYQDYQYNKNVYPELLRQWERSWFCMKCGHRFTL